jgi:hypothetical protein
MNELLTQKLIENGWVEIKANWEYRKENWHLLRDTSDWWIVATTSNARVFDVVEPKQNEIAWTFNLIEHLCKMEDERTRLRKNLEDIQSSTQEATTRALAGMALSQCYHTWLITGDKLHCPVCNSVKEKE